MGLVVLVLSCGLLLAKMLCFLGHNVYRKWLVEHVSLTLGLSIRIMGLLSLLCLFLGGVPGGLAIVLARFL